jgi:hypothetical protein
LLAYGGRAQARADANRVRAAIEWNADDADARRRAFLRTGRAHERQRAAQRQSGKVNARQAESPRGVYC